VNDTAVEVRNLTVRFGDFIAVNHISFNVRRGEVFGFLGANGAGKTTTIRVLCGLLNPSDGFVSVAGASFVDGEQAIKARVGYMSQKFTLYNDLTVEENLNFAASLRKLNWENYAKRREELFKFISFDRSVKVLVRDLPGGTKQQISLCASLLHDPEIIFLDEPTSGVTPAARSRFWALIRKLSERGKTVFVTTHHLDEAEQCDRIALMRDGKIIALDTPAALKELTFPMPMLELEPRASMSFTEMSAMGRPELFLFFEPYGLRFHATIRNEAEWEKSKGLFEEKFKIRKITPTLEDVFIRTSEGKFE
jgi:ABC-2 type transport system ATP-binding protein